MSSNKNSENTQYVRRTTMVVSVIAALLFGLYMGTLIPSFGSFSSPTNADGNISNQEAKLDAEIAKAKTATENDPKNARAWVKLGNLYYDAGNATESVIAYTKALELEPNNANVLTDRGTMYRELGQYDLALQSYSKATSVNPTHKNSLFNAGVILYYDLGRKAEAIERWEQLLRIDPNAKTPNGQLLSQMIKDLR